MRWSTSNRARGVMTRPTFHRRSGLFGTSMGTSFGFSVLSCARHCPTGKFRMQPMRDLSLVPLGLFPLLPACRAVATFRCLSYNM
jgi:hypothetical protein